MSAAKIAVAGSTKGSGAMGLTYFKRYRMEIDLARIPVSSALPVGYRLFAWDSRFIASHAEAKCQSFRTEIDANVFPCLGEYDGCLRLMTEISRKDGFLPGATWLLMHEGFEPGHSGQSTWEPCGTVQGIRDRSGLGAIQNLGVAPEHRGRGLGSVLLIHALEGFRQAGLRRAFLEVTAQNDGAVRLYRRLGFAKVRTVYKAVELMSYAVR
ncbi:MAG TPA: GNAT family N-acetyltransferase [Pirellulales bacterium]|nr:GNAT family N-acetyltransferase [Pirellulales bacterium]